MPRVDVPRYGDGGIADHDGTVFTFQNGDTVNQHQVRLTGKEILVVFNSAGASGTVTLDSTPDERGRERDLGPITMAAGEYRRFGPFDPNQGGGWAQSNGYLNVDVSAATMRLAVLLIPDRVPV